MPADLDNVSRFVDITVELINRYLLHSLVYQLDVVSTVVFFLCRGYTDEEIQKVLGLNTIRVLREAEAVSARLRKTTRPSEAICC